jgi:hypothetical protein
LPNVSHKCGHPKQCILGITPPSRAPHAGKLAGRVPVHPRRRPGGREVPGTCAWACMHACSCRRAPVRHPQKSRLGTWRRGARPHLICRRDAEKISSGLSLDLELLYTACHLHTRQADVVLRAPTRAPATPNRIQALYRSHAWPLRHAELNMFFVPLRVRIRVGRDRLATSSPMQVERFQSMEN